MNFKKNTLGFSSVNYKNVLKQSIEDDGQTVKKIVITQEYEYKKYNVKGYNYYILNTIDELKQVTKNNMNIHEVIQYNKPVKPYLDIDLKVNEGIILNKTILLNEILNTYNNIFSKAFKLEIDFKDFVILDSTSNEKISFHIVVNNGKYFINNEQQKEFIKYVKTMDITLSSNIKINDIVDSSVYNCNKNFRMLNQSKIGKDSTFKITSDHKFKHSLIVDYFNKSENNILECSFIFQTFKNQVIRTPLINTACNKNINNIIYLEEDKQDLNTLLSFIDSSKFENTVTWRMIGIAIKNINYDFYDLFDFYSKGCKGYDEDNNLKLYIKNSGPFSWDFLYSMATAHELSSWVRNKLIKDYIDFDTPTTPENIKIIEDDSKYINEKLLIECNSKHLLIKAMMGRGKSEATKKYITFLNNNKSSDFVNKEIIRLNKHIEVTKRNIKNYEEEKNNDWCKHLIENFQEKIKKAEVEINRIKKINKVDEQKQLNILIVSPRITFSQHMEKEFKITDDFVIKNYIDVGTDNLKKYNESLIISVESLYHLNPDNKYDVIILDECESILNQFSSPTCQHKNNCFNMLFNFVVKSKKIIYADAFIGSRTYEFLNNFMEEKTLIINNSYVSNNTVNIYKTNQQLEQKLLNELKEGKKIYAHFTSCEAGLKMKNTILSEGILTDDQLIYYSSKETIKEGAIVTNNNKLKNINDEWGKLKYISSTSSITVGNSYTKKDVDSVYIFGGLNSCCVRDSFQNHKRIRHILGDINVHFPNSEIYDDKEETKKIYTTDLLNYKQKNITTTNELKKLQWHQYFINRLEQNEIFYLLNSENIKDNDLKIFLFDSIDYDLYEQYNNNLEQSEERNIKKKFKELLKDFNIINNNYNNSLDKINNLNNFERFINNKLYDFVFMDYLKKMNYKINFVKGTTIKNKIELVENEIYYNEIEDISRDLAEDYILKEKKSEGLTYTQKLEKEKYFYKKCFENDDDNDRLAPIFELVYNKNKHEFKNLILEFNYYKNKEKYKSDLKKKFKKLETDQTETNINYLKLFEILELNKLFNIEGSYNSPIIDASTLNKNFNKYITKKDKIKNIESLFNLKYNIKNIDNLKYNRTFLGNIYNKFNGSKLINNEIKRTPKTDIAINFRLENIIHKNTGESFLLDINEESKREILMNIDSLFKIYKDFTINNGDYDFID